jgi:hypothetical protein
MPEFHALFLLELVVFSGAALAWGFWELWQTNKAMKKTKAEEEADKGADPPV